MKIGNSIFIALAVLSLQLLNLYAQGNLTPSGPPGAAMLTLSQVEPRTPVDATHTPGNSGAEFVITNSGSYYLTTNITGVSGEDGIDIDTNNVTLDLNGFSLTGVAGSQEGIQIFNCTNVIVHNGVISGWGFDGILSTGNNVTLEHLAVSGNESGLIVQNTSVIRYCTVNANENFGIAGEANDCLILGNVCLGNDAANFSQSGSIEISGANEWVENNHITVTSTAGYGIMVEAAIGVTNNVIVKNFVQGGGANDYYYSTSQIVGPFITNSVFGFITNSSPWANFQF